MARVPHELAQGAHGSRTSSRREPTRIYGYRGPSIRQFARVFIQNDAEYGRVGIGSERPTVKSEREGEREERRSARGVGEWVRGLLGTALALGRVITRFVSRKPPGSTQTRTASHVIENTSPSLLLSLQLRRFFPSFPCSFVFRFNALLPLPRPVHLFQLDRLSRVHDRRDRSFSSLSIFFSSSFWTNRRPTRIRILLRARMLNGLLDRSIGFALTPASVIVLNVSEVYRKYDEAGVRLIDATQTVYLIR